MEGYIGELKMFAGNFAPRNWAICNGQLLPVASNSALFSILGTTYGGDGRTTFALPDLRGRVPVSPGAGPGLSNVTLGQRMGNERTQLTYANLPPMPVKVSSANGNKATPANGDSISKAVENQGRSANELDSFNSASPDITLNAATVPGGNSTPMSNMQPSLGMNYIVCLMGIYPSRS